MDAPLCVARLFLIRWKIVSIMGYFMFIVAFIIGYPLFMIAAYLLGKLLFVKIEEDEETEKLREESRMLRENRLRLKLKKQRLLHA
jgi:H+/gluconate symporter-like permease